MKQDNCKVFLILKVLKDKEKVAKHAFIATDRERAKLYAKNWADTFIYYGVFELREIAEIKDNKLQESNIFIMNFFNCEYKSEIKRRNILRDKKLIEEAKNEKDIQEQIKILFQARRI